MPRPRLKNLLPSPALKLLVALLIVFALAGGIWYGVWVTRNRGESVPPLSEEETGEIPSTQPNLKVAFIGDSGYGGDFESVLRLIESEEADLVLHQGDFDCVEDPIGFFAKVDAILGSEFPYFASVGNHDVASWAGYAELLQERMARLDLTLDDPGLSDQKFALTYEGLRMVFVGENGRNAEFAQFLQDQLPEGDRTWKICSWHKNQTAMQVGSKGNEMGWEVYETCRRQGAIIATGHEHSYHRTKTLASIKEQTVDESCSDPNDLCVSSGKTFVFVSGLGGKSIRDQDRCLPTTYPYGCRGEWAKIYTSDQKATHGALFIEFHVDGDPYKARGYFKNIKGKVIDEFEITTF